MISISDLAYCAFGLGVYQVLRILVQCIVSHAMPSFYLSLKRSKPHEFKAYFVFPIGFLVTVITAPICMNALTSTDTESEVQGLARNISTAGKICLGSRAVLWTSELPLLSYSLEYVIHHTLSLTSLSLIVLKRLPLQPLYLIYTGLISEVFSDTTALLRFHALNPKNSKFYSVTAMLNVLALLLVRLAPAVALSTIYPMQGRTSLVMQAYLASIIFYCCWLLRLAFRQLASLGHVSVVLTRPAHIRFSNGWSISIYSLILGVAMVAAQISTAFLYTRVKQAPLSMVESYEMASLALGTVVAGLFGAAITNSWMLWLRKIHSRAESDLDRRPEHHSSTGVLSELEHEYSAIITTNSLLASSGQDEKKMIGVGLGPPLMAYFTTFKGISVQGGTLFSAVWVLLSSQAPSSLDNTLILYCMATSLLLGEGIGRVGCYFGGCCGSERFGNRDRFCPAVQLFSSLMNVGTFFAIIFMTVYGYIDERMAGTCAVFANGAIRLVTNPFRQDAKEDNITGLFAVCQLVLFTALMLKQQIGYDRGALMPVVVSILLVVGTLFGYWLSVAVWLRLAVFIPNVWLKLKAKIPWVSRPVAIVYVFSICVIAAVLYSDAPSDIDTKLSPVGYNNQRLNSCCFPLILCALITIFIPTLAMSTWSA